MSDSTSGVRPVPQGYHNVTPALILDDAAAAIDFYKRALGAQELMRMPAPDGKHVWHAELQIGDSRIMLGDETPEMADMRAPKSLGGTTNSLHVYVDDVDGTYQRALEAGATSVLAPMDAFWGDRYARVVDPFGHQWAFARHQEDPTPEEMQSRIAAMMAGQQGSGQPA